MALKRNYVTAAEVNELAGFTPTDIQIAEAEELIDAYVGFQDKFLDYNIEGMASAGGASTITLQQKEVNVHDADFFKLCVIEILGGTGEGQRRRITASTLTGVLTVDSAWTTQPSSDSFYRIYQLGKFPRKCDVTSFSEVPPTKYFKQIIEQIKRAVAMQCEYMNAMGDSFFASDTNDKQSESIGDYSYSLGSGTSGLAINRLIAPKAKQLLRGIRNITGQIVA